MGSNEKRHRLLERQIRRSGFNELSSTKGEAFIDEVNKTYQQFAYEFKILEENTEHMLHKISESNNNLQSIVESLDSFNYHISHDLKNTLINTLSLGQMASKYLEKENYTKLSEIMQKLISTSNTGLSLVEKFLQLSKFESDLIGQQYTEVNLPQTIYQIKEHHLLKDDLQLTINKQDFNTLKCKELGIRSLFQNLIINSVKYADPNRELKIEIDLINSGIHKVIRFRDNGIGIDLKENGDKLFKPFVRIENGLDQEGTGVGLFLVRKVVIEHGGTIEVVSELNKGTELIIFL